MTSLDLIRNYLREKTNIDPKLVEPEARLADLGIDSFALLELIFEFEEQWNVSITTDTNTPETVQNLIDIVEKITIDTHRIHK